MKPTGLRRAVALTTIAITVAALPATTVWSSDAMLHDADGARFEGRVFRSDGVSPRPEVVVALYDEESGDVFRSGPTDESGGFRIAGAPPGTYALVTEASEGAFLAGENVELAAGANRPVSLTLTDNPPVRNLAPGQTSGQKSGPSTLVKWIIAGGIIVAGLFVINELTDDGESNASDF
jgi:hypothetical protein